MNFNPIKRLRLKAAYEDAKAFADVVRDEDFLVELFEWSERGTIFIVDDTEAGYSRFVTDTNGLGFDKALKVVNRGHKDMFLWHIDGLIYKKDSKCDCALLTDESIRFIEFKSNAANKTREAIIANYDKAKNQLKLTFEDVNERCRKVGIDLKTSARPRAYAVFNRTVPSLNAYQKKLAAQFLLETDGVSLEFKNETVI